MTSHATAAKRNGRTRKARGFSRDELREAGINRKQALKRGIPIDLRRKTKHKENVKALKQHLRRSRSTRASKSHEPE